MRRPGDYFLFFETHPGSGEQGCVQVYQRHRRYPNNSGTPQLTYVKFLGHTCHKARGGHKARGDGRKLGGMHIELFELRGQIIWVKP